MVTSVKRTQSPFLRSQSADFIVFTCTKRPLCLQKINSGSKYSKVKITSVTCFHRCLEIDCLNSDVQLFLTVMSTLNIKLIFIKLASLLTNCMKNCPLQNDIHKALLNHNHAAPLFVAIPTNPDVEF